MAMSKMSIATFSIGAGKLGMTLEKNCVAKVGEAGTQAVTHGVQPGWVLRKIGELRCAKVHHDDDTTIAEEVGGAAVHMLPTYSRPISPWVFLFPPHLSS